MEEDRWCNCYNCQRSKRKPNSQCCWDFNYEKQKEKEPSQTNADSPSEAAKPSI
jgi:hypothetical protein